MQNKKKTKILIVKTNKGVVPAVKKIFREFEELKMKPGTRVLIKPSLVNSRPSFTGTTTSLRLIEAVIKKLLAQGAKITIGEGSGFEFKTDQVFSILHFDYFKKRYGIETINLRKTKTVTVPIKGKVLKKLTLSKVVLDADKIINLAKLKTHTLTGMTISLKNLFGLLSDKDRKRAHIFGLNQSIIDLNLYLRDKVFSIVDATTAMEGEGPVYGDTRKLDLLMASQDSFALDLQVCHLVGLDPRTIGHLRLARKYTPKRVGVKSELKSKIKPFKLPTASSFYRFKFRLLFLVDSIFHFLSKKSLIPFIYRHFGTRLVFDLRKCDYCQKCVKICPLGAISKEITIDYNQCSGVRCLRCYEVCPKGAIFIKGFSKPKKRFYKPKEYERLNAKKI